MNHFTLEDIQSYCKDIGSILSHVTLRERIEDEQRIQLPKVLGTGTIERMQIRTGMEIIISDVELSQNLSAQIEETSGIFELNYFLSGEAVCHIHDQQVTIVEPISHVCYFQDVDVRIETKANTRCQFVEIRMSPENLLHYFDRDADKQAIQHIMQKKKGLIQSYQLSPMIKKCVYEILHCPYKGALKKIYFEAKAMELINLFFQENDLLYPAIEPSLPADDVEKLKQAKEIVLRHIDEPYSIKTLAKMVGLNEYKLKIGFRQLFDTTIFGLIRRRRMEKAAWLLEREGVNVSEAAVQVGYSNVSNFTVAFRKQYGCNPSEYLKRVKSFSQ
ncbi:helix-turn-helix transcriptional regulator [Brevibacillus reuszeri]|uniref:helix-turn-helix transcriptional regulator n=1 Tax=Brevibacillus reuszeri TaxID=54915 RepID=UPI0013DE9680|nr:AraC family transcriptional regulator [Brevibacillus reuszeri]